MVSEPTLRIAPVFVLALSIGGQAAAVSPPPVQAENGMVVSGQHLASEVGAEILNGGGNAVDATVAVGYALAVVLPCCGNIGGGGFATLHLANGKDLFFNFREKAPGAATETMYLDAAGEIVPDLSLRGYKAVGVPGSVLGLAASPDAGARHAFSSTSRTAIVGWHCGRLWPDFVRDPRVGALKRSLCSRGATV